MPTVWRGVVHCEAGVGQVARRDTRPQEPRRMRGVRGTVPPLVPALIGPTESVQRVRLAPSRLGVQLGVLL
jgi:hypothetical protein